MLLAAWLAERDTGRRRDGADSRRLGRGGDGPDPGGGELPQRVFSAEDATAMTEAGADIVVCHLGLTTGGSSVPGYRQGTQPSGLLMPPVAACLELVRDVLRSRESASASGRMHAVLSEAAGLAAWLQVDLQNIAGARRYYRIAVDAAERSGHRLLPTYMRASLGQFAAEAGDTNHGLNLVREARHRLPHNAPPVAHVWLDAIEARALAEKRDREALTLIRSSQARLAGAAGNEPVWPWVFSFDEPKLATYRSVCQIRLGHTAEARTALTEAAAAVKAPKQHAVLQVELARTLWGDGEAESSCALALAALKTALSLESERVHDMVRDLRRAMGDQATAVTAELDDRLAAAYQVGS